MLRLLVKTEADHAVVIPRLVLGALFFAHGSQLMLGWFGGYGFNGSMQFFTQQLGIPAFLAISTEFFGGLMLIAGLLGRVAALAIISTMVVAVAQVHWQFGLFMNWFGNQKGEGYEYHLLAISIGLLVVFRGSGACSIDRLLVQKREHISAEVDERERTDARPVTSL